MEKNTIQYKHRLNYQLILGFLLTFFGIGLLIAGFLVKPTGEIHPSVLTAFGEVATFAGALIGIDYSYSVQALKYIKGKKDKEQDENKDE